MRIIYDADYDYYENLMRKYYTSMHTHNRFWCVQQLEEMTLNDLERVIQDTLVVVVVVEVVVVIDTDQEAAASLPAVADIHPEDSLQAVEAATGTIDHLDVLIVTRMTDTDRPEIDTRLEAIYILREPTDTRTNPSIVIPIRGLATRLDLPVVTDTQEDTLRVIEIGTLISRRRPAVGATLPVGTQAGVTHLLEIDTEIVMVTDTEIDMETNTVLIGMEINTVIVTEINTVIGMETNTVVIGMVIVMEVLMGGTETTTTTGPSTAEVIDTGVPNMAAAAAVAIDTMIDMVAAAALDTMIVMAGRVTMATKETVEVGGSSDLIDDQDVLLTEDLCMTRGRLTTRDRLMITRDHPMTQDRRMTINPIVDRFLPDPTDPSTITSAGLDQTDRMPLGVTKVIISSRWEVGNGFVASS